MADTEVGGTAAPHAIESSYADSFHLRSTPLDFKLAFAKRLLVVGGDGTIDPGDVINWTHEVTMSPQGAKQLSQLLSSQVAHYEKAVGVIEGVDLKAAPSRKRGKKAKAKGK